MARQYKTNEVKVDIASFIHYWRGLRKVGKTTLFRDLILEKYGSLDKGLLISVGNEDGYQALDGLVHDVAEDWDVFVEIIDDLVENKTDNTFEIIAWDTVDEVVKIAIEEVMRLHKRKKGSPAESLNAALGGYGAGRQKVNELIDEQMTRLKRAGYGIIFIGHTKIKDIKEKLGAEYSQLTSNLTADYDGIFANKADIIMTISVDKDVSGKIISGTQRYMHFRDDGFVDCGSRFKNMPEKVEFGAKEYIEAFEFGVKSSIGKDISDTEYTKKEKEEKKNRQQKYEKYMDELKSSPEYVVTELKNILKSTSADNQKKIGKKIRELGLSIKDLVNGDADSLNEVLEFAEALQ